MTLKKKLADLKKRSLVVQAIRDFFIRSGYLEVETPLRCPAIIPEAQIEPVMSEDFYLQASPELCMKRLLSYGFDTIFQICKCFRKNERGHLHLPELTLLEWYAKNRTYLDLMEDCENLIRSVSNRLNHPGQIRYQGSVIHLDAPWQRLSVKDAFDQFASTSMKTALSTNCFDEIISLEIEPRLGGSIPVFLYDYPAEHASLARLTPDNPGFSQRFELYIAGIELANAFTELTDAAEQKKRFINENESRKAQGKSWLPLPDKFLTDLEKLPDAAGIALGVDRLVMLFCDTAVIDDVIAFPPEAL